MPDEKITATEARQATMRPRAMVLVLFASLFLCLTAGLRSLWAGLVSHPSLSKDTGAYFASHHKKKKPRRRHAPGLSTYPNAGPTVSQPYSTSTNKPSLLCLWGHIDEKMKKPRGQGSPGTLGRVRTAWGKAPTVVKTFGKAQGSEK